MYISDLRNVVTAKVVKFVNTPSLMQKNIQSVSDNHELLGPVNNK